VNTLRSVAEIRRALAARRATATIGLVPTMGAFHAGHVALFRAARQAADVVVVSSFVNPAQFGDPADLAAYPRDAARDAAVAAGEGVDLLFAPEPADMYPARYATWIEVEGPARGLEADFRPGHFRGVATICLKLFTIVRPNVACFGQKDAQQVAVVTQLVRDLNLDLRIEVVPTVRDSDGLALSSRNARLSPEERSQALAIPRALAAGHAAYRGGRDPVAAARALLAGLAPDYVAVADLNGHPTLAVAVRVGATRLIDNVLLDRPSALPPTAMVEHSQSQKESGDEHPADAPRT
jgi:pantoate--beta-alanine ligase